MHTIQAEITNTTGGFGWAAWMRAGCALARRDLTRVLMLLETALERRRERRFLAGLDDRALADLGLSRADAWREASKGCWRD
jgi:uncharacterized protein YjiS (DUF1127 family)